MSENVLKSGWKQLFLEDCLNTPIELPNGFEIKLLYFDSEEYYDRLHSLIKLKYQLLANHPEPPFRLPETVQQLIQQYC